MEQHFYLGDNVFTKGEDIGVFLVDKVESNIQEKDVRNLGLPDNVHDYTCMFFDLLQM